MGGGEEMMQKLTDNEIKHLGEMVNGRCEVNSLFWKSVFDDFEKSISIQYELLDEQFKAELSKIKFRGEITPEKVKRHGFKFIHHEGVGTYITRNSIRVTDIFFKCSL